MVNDDRQSAIRRFVLVSVVGPLLVSAIAVVIQLFALPHVSTQVAVHWGTDGPDQLGPSWIFPTLTGGLAIGFVVLISLPITVSFARSPSGQPPTNLRFVTASLWAVTVFFGTSLTAALYLQRGLEATDPITGMGVWAGVAVGLGILAAAAGLIAAPGRMPSGQPTLNANVEELNISVGERLVWSRTVPLNVRPRLALWAIAIVSTSCAGYVVMMMPISWWVWMIIVAAVFAIVTALALQHVRVTVSARGLRVYSGIGITLQSVDSDQIIGATTRTLPRGVGRGVRFLDDGSRAIVMNPGPVLHVHTKKPGTDLVVSLPNPDEAVTVLRTLVLAPM